MGEGRARGLVAFIAVAATIAGCASSGMVTPTPDAASPSRPVTVPPTAEPTTAVPSPSPTAQPTPQATPVSLAEPSGVTFDVRDEGTCPSDPRAMCSIDERIVTLSWKAPRADGVEIRVYGVTKCFGTNADGTVIDGACLREHTPLPSAALVLLATAPASQGDATVHLVPSARGLADTQRGEKVYSIVLGAFDASGDQSVMAIATTQGYCETTKAPCTTRKGVTMTGTAELGDRPGRLVIRVSMAGLEPGASVTLTAAATYRASWSCGEAECSGEGLCGPADGDETAGSAKATVHAAAGPGGTASARLRLVAPPPAAACPADPAAPWYGAGERWTRIKVTDPERRLRLTPDAVEATVVY